MEGWREEDGTIYTSLTSWTEMPISGTHRDCAAAVVLSKGTKGEKAVEMNTIGFARQSHGLMGNAHEELTSIRCWNDRRDPELLLRSPKLGMT